jgi:chromate transporter
VNVALLVAIGWRFAVLSLFAVGSGISVIVPQMHAEFVDQLHLLDDRAFTEMLAISQATPGPNFLFAPLVGWRIAGIPGALVALGCFLLFPFLITLTVGRLMRRHENATIRRVRRSFPPVTGGLWIASGIVVALATDRALVPVLITASVFVASLVVDISPLWWCLGAAVVGAALI